MLKRIRNLPWLRWLGEFAIIVVGVLVALAVDSYREDLIDVEREQIYLTNLHTDLEVDANNLLAAVGYARSGLRQIESLMYLQGMDLDDFILRSEIVADGYNRESIGPESYVFKLKPEATELSNSTRGVSDESAEGIFVSWPGGIFDTFVAYEATYTTLLSTGDLKIIRNEQLRRAISTYYERIRRSNVDANDLGRHIQLLNEFLRDHDINPYMPEDLARISDIPGIEAALSLARDKHHWWYLRKLQIKEDFDVLRSELANELRQRNIEIGDI